MNGFDVQTEADAMLERQRRDIMPRLTATPRTPATPAAASRYADLWFPQSLLLGDLERFLSHVFFEFHSLMYVYPIWSLREGISI